jgi:hypothetical protein
MIEETIDISERHSEHGSGCQCGCSSKPKAPAVVEEKAANEQPVSDEEIRARNKRVRAPRSAPGPDSPPPFSDHSGTL